jgi:cytochrome b6-f complex iron-sulfur subunit
MTRRDLIQKVILGSTTLIVLPQVFTSCSKDATDPDPIGNGNGNGNGDDKITIDLKSATYSALNTAGGTVLTKGVIIANTGNNVFVALSSTCTHEGCTIGYSLAANNFPCPCHGSIYSVTGSVLNGPAPAAVKSYPVNKTGDILTISLG